MAIYNGTQKVKPSGVSKVYVGSQLVYQSGPQTYYLSDGTHYMSGDKGAYVEAVNSITDAQDFIITAEGYLNLASDTNYWVVYRNRDSYIYNTTTDRFIFNETTGKISYKEGSRPYYLKYSAGTHGNYFDVTTVVSQAAIFSKIAK